ncbi:MAG: TRAP transporter small permease subunit [Pseudomonadota bacterium]
MLKSIAKIFGWAVLAVFLIDFIIFRSAGLGTAFEYIVKTYPTGTVRFIYYGGSNLAVLLLLGLFVAYTIVGVFFRDFLWGTVRFLEGMNNSIGRVFAWAGLFMVIQQILIVFLQRIFRVSAIEFGLGAPFGYKFFDFGIYLSHDLSWYSEELKLFNAMIVVLCCSYTFVQGGHVRVDLFYANMSFRKKKITDMLGSLLFMMPMTLLVWKYGWFFMWRHLVTPNFAATTPLQRMELQSRILKPNVETIGFSPNGFDAYWLFKLLLLSFAFFVFFAAVAFFYRSLLEYIEGEESENKYLDRDRGAPSAAEEDAAQA